MNDDGYIYILCYSGGKDSTAMLIHLLENNKPIDEILYVDVGDWMWDCAKEHNKLVEEKLGVKLTVLDLSEELYKGFKRWGFPSFFNRWCTGAKRDLMKKYIKEKYPDSKIIQYIGYCADEEKRLSRKLYSSYDVEFPLVDAGITTVDALNICGEYGFDFGGVYEHHSHFNCWLCPLQRKKELRYIFNNESDLWDRLRDMQFKTDGCYYPNESIFDLEKQFWEQNHEVLKRERMASRVKYNKRNKKS